MRSISARVIQIGCKGTCLNHAGTTFQLVIWFQKLNLDSCLNNHNLFARVNFIMRMSFRTYNSGIFVKRLNVPSSIVLIWFLSRRLRKISKTRENDNVQNLLPLSDYTELCPNSKLQILQLGTLCALRMCLKIFIDIFIIYKI